MTAKTMLKKTKFGEGRKMNKCKCGAIWRTNYPFGKKSKPVTSFEKEHDKECVHNKKNKNKIVRGEI